MHVAGAALGLLGAVEVLEEVIMIGESEDIEDMLEEVIMIGGSDDIEELLEEVIIIGGSEVIEEAPAEVLDEVIEEVRYEVADGDALEVVAWAVEHLKHARL